MLSGESIPVTKTQLAPSGESEVYYPDVHKRSTLFCGTRVIQTRYYGNTPVRAVILRTGEASSSSSAVSFDAEQAHEICTFAFGLLGD